MLKFLKFLLKLCLSGVMIGVLAGSALYWYVTSPLSLPSERVEFQVSPGSSLWRAAQDIRAAGVGIEPRVFTALGKFRRAEAAIKAGNYEISRGINALELLDKLTRGDVLMAEITFVEGITFRQLREKLNAHPDIRHETQGLPEAEIMRRVGAPETSAEGSFFPDTYRFSKQSRDIDILTRAYHAMQRHLAREWAERDAGLPYTNAAQALVMASIIEKETGRDADRPMIAAVFVNRLRRNMLLQTDPSVIYGLGEAFDGNLRKRDLMADTPYNTYTRPGLPPTPIAMPGLASLRAALHPEDDPALYFVARGDGSSHFSQTLEEHSQAVNRYQRGRREVPSAPAQQGSDEGKP